MVKIFQKPSIFVMQHTSSLKETVKWCPSSYPMTFDDIMSKVTMSSKVMRSNPLQNLWISSDENVCYMLEKC